MNKILAWAVLAGMLFPWGWLLSYLGVVGAIAGFSYQCGAWLMIVIFMAIKG